MMRVQEERTKRRSSTALEKIICYPSLGRDLEYNCAEICERDNEQRWYREV